MPVRRSINNVLLQLKNKMKIQSTKNLEVILETPAEVVEQPREVSLFKLHEPPVETPVETPIETPVEEAPVEEESIKKRSSKKSSKK